MIRAMVSETILAEQKKPSHRFALDLLHLDGRNQKVGEPEWRLDV